MNSIQIFENPKFGKIRTMTDEKGEPLFCLTDVCRVLELVTSKTVQRLSDDVLSKYPIVDSIGRKQLANFVNEDGLYDVILDSRKPEARRFRKWVTAEVLPAIRKTGGYIPVEKGDDDAIIMAKALLICQRTIEQQTKVIEEQAPQVEFANAIQASDGSILVGGLAKLIAQNGVDIGQNRLFRWMRDNGYLGNRGRHRNVANQRFVDQGLFELEENVIDTDGGSFIRITTLVTGHGQQYFINGFLNGRFNV